nr:Zgc:158620 protein [Danio rerio]
MELECGKNVDFWRDMTTITEDEISKLRKLEASGKGPGDRREGINTSVSTDVQSVFKGKTYSQLQALYMNIESKIQAGGSNLDIGYWESLLQQVRVYMARARLRERHQDVLRQKLYKLKQEQGVESEPLFPIIKEEPEKEQPISREAGSGDEEAGSSSQQRDREKEAEHFKTWAEQEDNFHLHQAKLRSKIRIRDGRAKPIDLLAKYISAEDDDLSVEMHEPYTFLNGLTVTDMEETETALQMTTTMIRRNRR